MIKGPQIQGQVSEKHDLIVTDNTTNKCNTSFLFDFLL